MVDGLTILKIEELEKKSLTNMAVNLAIMMEDIHLTVMEEK